MLSLVFYDDTFVAMDISSEKYFYAAKILLIMTFLTIVTTNIVNGNATTLTFIDLFM